MEWIKALRQAVGYMELHLTDAVGPEDVARAVHISPYYFATGFKLMTGYTVKEYLRGRRLYLAALELLSGHEKVIDLAWRYGYETPESFSRAFQRFHGVTPSMLRGDSTKIRPFLPLKITVTIQGGNDMDYVIETMEAFAVIGVSRQFGYDSSYREIPQFWDAYMAQCQAGAYSPEVLQALERCNVGEFGVCIDDDPDSGKFRYMIAGRYDGGTVPDGLEVYTLPAATWAKFRCLGPLPGALQSVNTEVYSQWLPGNPKYEMAGQYNLEWYSCGNTASADYESAIWMPVREK